MKVGGPFQKNLDMSVKEEKTNDKRKIYQKGPKGCGSKL